MATGCPSNTVICVGPIKVTHKVTSPQIKILARAEKCLSIPDAHHNVTSCIAGKSNFSLRLLDWFVTTYARIKNLRIDRNDQTQAHVYENYKSALMLYKRRDFDPFRRIMKRGAKNKGIPRVEVTCPDGSKVMTTIGQLNFLCWAYRNSIIEYINEHQAVIEEQMQSMGRNPVRQGQMPVCSVTMSKFQVTL